jgi:hypothetical protein
MNRPRNKISVLVICFVCCVSCWAGSILAMPIFGWILWSSVFYPATTIARWMHPVGTPASLAFAIGFIQSCLMAFVIWAGYLTLQRDNKK